MPVVAAAPDYNDDPPAVASSAFILVVVAVAANAFSLLLLFLVSKRKYGKHSTLPPSADHCARAGPSACHPLADCINGHLNLTCRCREGFKGDGVKHCEGAK